MATNPFLKQNKKEQEPIEIFVSDNFKDEKGPVPFILKIISAEEADRITDTCIEPVIDPQTRRKVGSEVNQKRLQMELLVKSIISPDLENKDLQESWDARNATDLLNKMLDMREKSVLLTEFDTYFKPSEQVSIDAEEETKNA